MNDIPIIHQRSAEAQQAYEAIKALIVASDCNPALHDNHAWTQIRLFAVDLFFHSHYFH